MKNLFNKVFNVVGGALLDDVIEGIAGAAVAGPAGFVHRAYHGTAEAVIYKGAMGLIETMRLELKVYNNI